jgi:Nineteen complex-related protein 2
LTSRDAIVGLPTEPAAIASRPSYTKEYLNQLRDSTPSTSQDIDQSTSQSSVGGVPEIPDQAVIRAFKERRRERAREEDYVSVSANETSSRKRDSDDDDEETYRSFVHEPVRLQKNMEAAEQKYKQEQIQEALYHSDDSEAMSEVDDNEWENLQIARAQPRLAKSARRDAHGMPREIPPVPTYSTSLANLRGQLQAMQSHRAELVSTVEQLEKETTEIKEREEAVQEALTKAGKEYETLQEEFRATGANRGLDEICEVGLS